MLLIMLSRAAATLVLLGASLVRLATQSNRTGLRDYPSLDRQVAAFVSQGLSAKAATAAMASAPLDPKTFELLFNQYRIDDALALLPRTWAGSPAQIEAVLRVVGDQLHHLQRDDARGSPEILRRALEPVRRQVPALAREDAARVAYALMSIDNQLDEGGSDGWQARTRKFALQYRGTDAAQLAELDVIIGEESNLLTRIDRLDRFWRDHRGTLAGAKALYLKGFELHVNVAITGVEPRGGDPTERLMQVVEIVKELESGRYPPSRWTTEAPNLISGFFVSTEPRPVIPPANVERMLAAYYDFVRTHFDTRTEDVIDSSIGYVVTSKMSDLFARQGTAAEGVERTLARLEREVRDPVEVRWFRAMYFVNQWLSGPADGRAAMGARARTALNALASEGAGYQSRKALATLASLAYYQRNHPSALPLYRRYLSAYPDSAWAWVAALRIGLAREAAGDWAGAASAYEQAVQRYGTEPPALVLASTLLARAREALGDEAKALAAYRRALDGWDSDYGPEYVLTGDQAPQAGPSARMADRLRVSREELTERVEVLARSAGDPGGKLLAKGRWQYDQRRFVEARATLEELLRARPSAPIAADGRALLHRTMFEHALELAAVDNRARNEATAAALLDELTRAEPSTVGAALGGMAKSALLVRRGLLDEARTTVRRTLERLVSVQTTLRSRPPATPLDADVAAIRSVVFRPLGDLDLLRSHSWSDHTFPGALPPFIIVSADIPVVGAGSETTRRVYQNLPGIERVVFLTRDELAAFERILPTIGGSATRARTGVMDTFNQPAGLAAEIGRVWGELFPTQPGHWGGTVLQTYPIISGIEFLDAARTRASAFITVGYSGATVVLEKVNGAWRAVRLTNRWIT